MTATVGRPQDRVESPSEGPPGRGPLHRSVALAAVAMGAYLVVLPFALSLFSRTPDAEQLADRYRVFASEEGLRRFDGNATALVRAGEQLLDEVLPALATDLGITGDELDEYVEARFPAVAVFQDRAPEVFAYLAPASARVAAQADNVEAADDFPAPGVPVTIGPWALLGGGLALVLVAARAHRAARPATSALALAVGLGLAGAPLALAWPHKVAAAQEVAEAARVAFDPDVARAATADIYMVDAALLEVRQAMLPAVAEELRVAPAELEAGLARDHPDVVAFLTEWQAGLSGRAHDLSHSQIQLMDEFRHADGIPYRALPWLFVGPGLALAAVAGAALLDQRRHRR